MNEETPVSNRTPHPHSLDVNDFNKLEDFWVAYIKSTKECIQRLKNYKCGSGVCDRQYCCCMRMITRADKHSNVLEFLESAHSHNLIKQINPLKVDNTFKLSGYTIYASTFKIRGNGIKKAKKISGGWDTFLCKLKSNNTNNG